MPEVRDLPQFTVDNNTKNLSDKKIAKIIRREAERKDPNKDLKDRALPISVERIRRIDDLVLNDYRWVRDTLGLSAHNRIQVPNLNNIHFYSDNIWQEFVKRTGLPKDSSGAADAPTRAINLLEQNNQSDTLHVLNHELVHTMGDIKIVAMNPPEFIKTDPLFVLHKSEFDQSTGDANFVREAIIEMIDIEMLDQYRLLPSGSDYLKNVGYTAGVVFADGLITDVARRQQRTPAAVRKDLYTAYFTGEEGAIEQINQDIEAVILAAQASDRHSGLTTDASFRFREQFDAWNRGKAITILDGRITLQGGSVVNSVIPLAA